MNRRDAIAALLALGTGAGPSVTRAQSRPSADSRTLGVLAPASSSQDAERFFLGVLRAQLKALGWIEGQNLIIEGAFADYKAERYPALAEELVRKRVDVIWAYTGPAAVAAARATKTIPIVFAAVPWPVETGLMTRLPDRGAMSQGCRATPDWRYPRSASSFSRKLRQPRFGFPGFSTRVWR